MSAKKKWIKTKMENHQRDIYPNGMFEFFVTVTKMSIEFKKCRGTSAKRKTNLESIQ